MAAYELIDWIRLSGLPLTSIHIQRITTIIVKALRPAFGELVRYLDPKYQHLWDTFLNGAEALTDYLDL